MFHNNLNQTLYQNISAIIAFSLQDHLNEFSYNAKSEDHIWLRNFAIGRKQNIQPCRSKSMKINLKTFTIPPSHYQSLCLNKRKFSSFSEQKD
ncbi:CLUMA_CG011736, isoform A [Clunio marinus]|uniref:CLUMA_CG011736, isoform A n=1 Tax=Clunio marinus TaxID=568069 RepID=A0A1J1IIU6_9DIPT|nr:CLUMA_CG011736, isoform A [Clunio marinus]